MPALNRDPLRMLPAWARIHGDVVRIAENFYVFNHPDGIEAVARATGGALAKVGRAGWQARALLLFPGGILASEGEVWRRGRKVAQPALHRDAVQRHADIMVRRAAALADRWTPGQGVAVHGEMQRLTVGITGEALFGVDLAPDELAGIGRALEELMVLAARPFRIPRWVPTRRNLRLALAMARVDRLLARIAAAAGRGGTGGGAGELARRIAAGAGGDRRAIRDQIGSLLFASHETTASALSWTWRLLADHPDVERKLAAELADVIGPRAPALADVPRLTYLDAVLKESLRLYPPIWIGTRFCVERCTLGGYDVPRGTLVSFSHYVVQRDPRWFDRPDEFVPERWQDGLADRLPRYAYMPFGGGPRYCLGQAFAQLEMALIVATIAQRRRLSAIGPMQPPTPSITLRPADGMPMRVDARMTPAKMGCK